MVLELLAGQSLQGTWAGNILLGRVLPPHVPSQLLPLSPSLPPEPLASQPPCAPEPARPPLLFLQHLGRARKRLFPGCSLPAQLSGLAGQGAGQQTGLSDENQEINPLG